VITLNAGNLTSGRALCTTGDRTGWSIKKLVRTARRYRTIEIRAGNETLTAEGPLRVGEAGDPGGTGPRAAVRGIP
jgi:hypothetical protein